MSKFYSFINANDSETDLYITGDIIANDVAWFYKGVFDYCCPKEFGEQLEKANGKKLNVIIDSCGGDTEAASVIYTMLRARSGETVAKVSGMAASAASVIAMGADKMLMSPTAMFMIHNPWTQVTGNAEYLKKVIDQLDACTESLVNAYERKTKLPRDTILQLMQNDTFMDVKRAMQLGFCDGVWGDENDSVLLDGAVLDSIKNQRIAIFNKLNSGKELNADSAKKADGAAEDKKASGKGRSEEEIKALEIEKQKALSRRF